MSEFVGNDAHLVTNPVMCCLCPPKRTKGAKVNNNDERDYSEEAANQREMEEPDYVLVLPESVESDESMRYFAMRTYDSHAEAWDIYPAPHMSGVYGDSGEYIFTDRTGQTWFVWHTFHHTTNDAIDQISELADGYRNADEAGFPVPTMHFVNLDRYPTYCPICKNHVESPDHNHS